MKKKKLGAWIIFGVLLIFLGFYLFPFYLVVINSFKGYGEIVANVLKLPESLDFSNFVESFKQMDYPRAFLNTFIVTALGTFGIVIIGSLAGYKISRTPSKTARIVFFLLIIPMMIPFQSFMISLVKVAKLLGLTGSVWGLSVIYWGLGAPMAIFLYRGFVKGIPRELDECAMLDGCNKLQTFVHVIFPILKPVNATVIVINAMWIWNDFLLPLLILSNNKGSKTLQLMAYTFIGQYKMEWQNIMSGVILTVVPSLLIYLFFQKHIIKGMVSGAVKG